MFTNDKYKNYHNSTASSFNQPSGSARAFNQLGMVPEESTPQRRHLQDESEDPTYYEDCMEGRPQLLYPKFQRLKNSTKLAKVVLIDEMPQTR